MSQRGRFASECAGRFAHMFDGWLPEIGDLAALNDAAVVDAAAGWARVEAAACARKQAAMAETFCRRTGLPADERELWWVDPEAAVVSELAAAQNISQGLALAQTHRGVALRDRLPKVAALFEAGLLNDLLVRTIVWRTYLINDTEAMAKVDADLADQVLAWGALSVKKTEQAIDALVEEHDPGALRRSRGSSQAREVQFGSPSDEAGFTSLWARLYAPDAAVLERRIDEMARGVCEQDPRTLAERRADALTAAGGRTGTRLRLRQRRLPGCRPARHNASGHRRGACGRRRRHRQRRARRRPLYTDACRGTRRCAARRGARGR